MELRTLVALLQNLILGFSTLRGCDQAEEGRITRLVHELQDVADELYRATDTPPLNLECECSPGSAPGRFVAAVASAVSARRIFIGPCGTSGPSTLVIPVVSLDPGLNAKRCVSEKLTTYQLSKLGRCDICSRAATDEYGDVFGMVGVWGHRESAHFDQPETNQMNPWLEATMQACDAAELLEANGLLTLAPTTVVEE